MNTPCDASEAAPDPELASAREARWSTVLNSRGRWAPREGPLVVLSPHPDDEILGAGGLMHTWSRLGHRVTVVSVTDGEADGTDDERLGTVRREELQGALRKLAPAHIAVVRLGIPDGSIERHRNRLRNALRSLLAADVTLVAPHERDGHPDNDAVGAVCAELCRTEDIALARYFIWRWHQGDPAALQNAPWGKFHLSIDARRAKSHALQCFNSQLRRRHGPMTQWPLLTYFERPYEAFLV